MTPPTDGNEELEARRIKDNYESAKRLANRRSVTEKPTPEQSSAVQETTKLPLTEEELKTCGDESHPVDCITLNHLILQAGAALQLQRRVEILNREADAVAQHNQYIMRMNGDLRNVIRKAERELSFKMDIDALYTLRSAMKEEKGSNISTQAGETKSAPLI